MNQKLKEILKCEKDGCWRKQAIDSGLCDVHKVGQEVRMMDLKKRNFTPRENPIPRESHGSWFLYFVSLIAWSMLAGWICSIGGNSLKR